MQSGWACWLLIDEIASFSTEAALLVRELLDAYRYDAIVTALDAVQA